MPQPLSRVKPHAQIHVSANALQQVPDFNTSVLRVIALWAHIDGNLASLFSTFLKSDIEVGTAVYQAFHGLETRRLALFAAAERAAPEWQQIALQAVWRVTKQSRDQRDRFCHHIWGYSPDLPKALMLMDSSVVVDSNVSYRQRAVELGNGRGDIAPRDLDKSRIFVYRKADFDRAVKDANKADWLVMLLYFAVGSRANEQGRRQLLREPQFQQAIQPLIRKKGPEVQAQLSPPGDDPPPKGTWDHL